MFLYPLIEDGDHVFHPLHEIGPYLWQAFNEHLSNGIKSGQGLCQFFCTGYTAAYGSCNASLRQLNLILTKALTIGAQNEKQHIDSDMILYAVNDIALV